VRIESEKIVPALLLLLNRRAPGEGPPARAPERREKRVYIPSLKKKKEKEKEKQPLLDGYRAIPANRPST
jgi:hypothetical protein